MATTLEIGQTIEQGSVRIHRYNDSIVVTDLTNAGKRGKTCRRLWIQRDYGCTAPNLDGFARVAVYCETLDQFRASVSDVLVDFPDACRVDEKELRAIDIAPVGYAREVVTGSIAIESEYDDFTVSDLTDTCNFPKAITESRRDAKHARAWLDGARDKVLVMSFHEVVAALKGAGVPLHTYCAMD